MKYLRTLGIQIRMFEDYINESIEDKANATMKREADDAKEIKKQLKEKIEAEKDLIDANTLNADPNLIKRFIKSEEEVVS